MLSLSGPDSAAGELSRYVADLLEAVPGPLRSIRVTAGNVSIELEWPVVPDPVTAPAAAFAAPVAVAVGAAAVDTASPAAGPAAPADDHHRITAPMVGTFYRALSPGAKPFVEVGDVLEKGRQVGILEAMKLMNAIESDVAGRVVEILVEDGAPVEYGQPLFVVARDGAS
nr:Acetyl-CoA carboxylase [uncultured bacterium]